MMAKKTDPDRRFYLRELRQALGLTQEEVAEAVDATKGQISQLETGHTQYNESWINRLCEGLGVEPSALFVRPGDVGGILFARLLIVWPHLSERRKADIINLAERLRDDTTKGP